MQQRRACFDAVKAAVECLVLEPHHRYLMARALARLGCHLGRAIDRGELEPCILDCLHVLGARASCPPRIVTFLTLYDRLARRHSPIVMVFEPGSKLVTGVRLPMKMSFPIGLMTCRLGRPEKKL